MSATLTLVSTRVNHPINHLTFNLAAFPPEVEVLTREIIETALDNLTFIAAQYNHYDDDLSRKLHIWCKQVIADFDENQKLDKEYIEDIALRIHELTHEILINPIDQARLLNPILVNDELPVWERRMWVDYRNVSELPAQDGRIHEFARDMLIWRNELPIAELNPLIEFEHAVFQPLQKLFGQCGRIYLNEDFYLLPQVERAIYYAGYKANAFFKKDLKGLQEVMQKEAMVCRTLWAKAKQHIAELTMEIEAKERQHTEMLKQSIQNMETSYRNEANILKQHIDSLRGQLAETAARLDICQQDLSHQASELRSLRSTMAQLAAQDAANRRKASRRGCIIS